MYRRITLVLNSGQGCHFGKFKCVIMDYCSWTPVRLLHTVDRNPIRVNTVVMWSRTLSQQRKSTPGLETGILQLDFITEDKDNITTCPEKGSF